MAKRFITPFAENGDRVAIPDDPTGTDVNYNTGYPFEYEQDPIVNPTTARFVERTDSNQLFNDITSNIKEWQENAYPAFIESASNGGTPFPYRKGAIVFYGGENYISLENSNTDTPPSSKWEVLGDNGRIPVTGGGSLDANKKYLIMDDSIYTLTDTTDLSNGDFVDVMRFGTATDTTTAFIDVDGANSEMTEYYNPATGILEQTDTRVIYNIMSRLIFLFNETSGNWEL